VREKLEEGRAPSSLKGDGAEGFDVIIYKVLVRREREGGFTPFMKKGARPRIALHVKGKGSERQ